MDQSPEIATDIVRLLNAVTASLVFAALVNRGWTFFKKYDRQQKLLHISFTLYTFATAYGSVEAYNSDVPPGFRVVPFLFANVIALYALTMYRKSAFLDAESSSIPDSSVG